MNNGDYAIFISASWNYVPFMNVLLNSMDKYGINCDVHMIPAWHLSHQYRKTLISGLLHTLSMLIWQCTRIAGWLLCLVICRVLGN